MRLADPTAEASFLALCLDMPETLECGLAPEVHSVGVHRQVHSTMLRMRSESSPIDDLTLVHALARLMDESRARGILVSLRAAPSRGASYLVPVLRRCYETRQLHEAGLVGAAAAEAGDIDAARAAFAAAAFGGATPLQSWTLLDAVEHTAMEWQQAEQDLQQGTSHRYIKLGLCPTVDGVLSAAPGDTILFAAETNVGKSSIMMTCLLSLHERGVPAGLVTVEDPEVDWGAKAVGFWAGVNTTPFWTGQGRDQWGRVMTSIGARKKQAQVVRGITAASGSLAEVQQAMALHVRVHGARVLFVDYIQAIACPVKNYGPKQAMDYVYQNLQATARMLGVPMVLGSQLARPQDQKDGKEPSLSRLKESGNLENGAQAVLMFWSAGDDWKRINCKFAKLKRTHQRPEPWVMERGNGGVLQEIGTVREVAGQGSGKPSW